MVPGVDRPVLPGRDRVDAAPVHGSATPSPAQFRALLLCIRMMALEITVAGRLRQMVEQSVGLTGAEHAVFAFRTDDGSGESYVFSSPDPELVATTRLVLALDGVSAITGGSATPLLKVAVQTGSGLAGNLFVVRAAGDRPFDAAERELLVHYASATAVGLDVVGHLEEARLRQQWLLATAEISRQLLTSADDEIGVWRDIAGRVLQLTNAQTVTISRPSEDDPDDLEVAVAAGVGAADLEGRVYPRAGSLAAEAMDAGHVQVAAEDSPHAAHAALAAGPLLALPLKGRGEARGAVLVTRQLGQPPFASADLRMAEDFATQAALALELAESRTAQNLLEARADQDRIAEGLQDEVIQRLFSIGLSLQSTTGELPSVTARSQLLRAVSDIDDTIHQIRSSVAPQRRGERSAAMALMRTTVLGLAEEVEGDLGFRPVVEFGGTLDAVVDTEGCAQVAAVLRSAFALAVRPASARHVLVAVVGHPDGLGVSVTDDGVGLGERGPGVSALWEQAAAAGHRFALERTAEGGLRLSWLLSHG